MYVSYVSKLILMKDVINLIFNLSEKDIVDFLVYVVRCWIIVV